MPLRSSFYPRVFHFDFAARTSRGALREKKSWFIKIWDESNADIFGIGECGPLPGLSTEDLTGLDALIEGVVGRINASSWDLSEFVRADGDLAELRSALDGHFDRSMRLNPSLCFALETALLDLSNGGRRMIFDNAFFAGQAIPINGLIWMGGLDFMLQQIEVKIRDGFKCIKVKVGGLDFEKELDILQYIRRKYFRENIVVRLDANGAFKPDDVQYKIKQLARFDIHSLEQPVRTGFKDLGQICRDSPIPIALDEELIGVHDRTEKEALLDRIRPAFLILKPTLHGGCHGCDEWISLAEQRKIGWWITSALESNIGLNAISQYAAKFPIKMPQGLGTGSIYNDNFPAPLHVKKGHLSYHPNEGWDLTEK